jgi:hypothetical protein
MPRPVGPFRDHTIPKVARRLNVPEHQLRRARAHGDLKTQSWAGVEWVLPEEEERLRLLLNAVRSPISDDDERKVG